MQKQTEKDPRNFIDPSHLQTLVQEQKSKQEISEELQGLIYRLINGIQQKRSFRGYTWLDEMKQEALLRCLDQVLKKDIKNAHPYLSTTVHFAFVQYIQKEKRYIDFISFDGFSDETTKDYEN